MRIGKSRKEQGSFKRTSLLFSGLKLKRTKVGVSDTEETLRNLNSSVTSGKSQIVENISRCHR